MKVNLINCSGNELDFTKSHRLTLLSGNVCLLRYFFEWNLSFIRSKCYFFPSSSLSAVNCYHFEELQSIYATYLMLLLELKRQRWKITLTNCFISIWAFV